MISAGVMEQTPLTSSYNRNNVTNSGRVLETNSDNLLRMVLNLKLVLLIMLSFLISSLNFQELQLLKWCAWTLQVSYCENDVDCRRLLQLVHFGEKFDSTNCQKTCDNCLKVKGFMEKDVTEIAKQLVWMLMIIGSPFSI